VVARRRGSARRRARHRSPCWGVSVIGPSGGAKPSGWRTTQLIGSNTTPERPSRRRAIERRLVGELERRGRAVLTVAAYAHRRATRVGAPPARTLRRVAPLGVPSPRDAKRKCGREPHRDLTSRHIGCPSVPADEALGRPGTRDTDAGSIPAVSIKLRVQLCVVAFGEQQERSTGAELSDARSPAKGEARPECAR